MLTMAEPTAAPEPSNAEPYHWDPQNQVGTDALQLWSEVGAGLDKNQTGKWVAATNCAANHGYRSLHPVMAELASVVLCWHEMQFFC